MALHLLPCGVLHPHVLNVVGPGVAVDAVRLRGELDLLARKLSLRPKLVVSDRAQLLLSVHVRLDELREAKLGDAAFGSTRRGIAPFYAAKYGKIGIPIAACRNEPQLRACIQRWLGEARPFMTAAYGVTPPSAAELEHECRRALRILAPVLGDTREVLSREVAEGRRVLLEGQLGALRDPDWGIYPWTTSSSTLAGYAAVGAPVPPSLPWQVTAVAKAYSTLVGTGPLVTEIDPTSADESGELLLRRTGHETGATTGRPRRIGWLARGCMPLLRGARRLGE